MGRKNAEILASKGPELTSLPSSGTENRLKGLLVSVSLTGLESAAE